MTVEPFPEPEARAAETAEQGIAVVTGASGGIGAAVTSGLTERGWDVVAHHRSSPVPPEAKAIATVQADLTDWDETRAMADDVLSRFGPPALIVGCAGTRDDGLLVMQSPERWRAVLDDNVLSVYHPLRAFLPAMVRAKRGSVVTVSSAAGVVASPGQTAYSAAKAAVIGLTRTLAAEYGKRGLRFNAVAPGVIDTEMTAEIPAKVREAIEARQSVAGAITTADVVDAVAYLATAPTITGQVLRLDLGLQL